MDRENAHLCRCPCTLPPEEQRCTDSFCQSLSGVLCFVTKDKVIHGWEIFPFPNSILHILFFRVLCWVVFFIFLSAVYLPFLLWSYFCCWEDLSLPSLSIPSFLPFIVTKTSILYVLVMGCYSLCSPLFIMKNKRHHSWKFSWMIMTMMMCI